MAKKKIEVLCIEDYSEFLNEDFVEYNKKLLEGRCVDEKWSGWVIYQKGKIYETYGLENSHAYVLSDVLFPPDHSVYRHFNENRPKRPRPVKMWQSFFDYNTHPKFKDGHQDFHKYFKLIEGEKSSTS